TVQWTPPASNGGSPITGYLVRVLDSAGAQVGALRPAAATATSLAVTGLTNGSGYRFQVAAANAVGTGPNSALSAVVVPATVPGAPLIATAAPGTAGGAVTPTAPRDPPPRHRGAPPTGGPGPGSARCGCRQPAPCWRPRSRQCSRVRPGG